MEFSPELRNTYVVKKKLPVESEERTRDVIARAILEGGPATAVDLAERLSITPAGIRRHLDALVAEGLLASREEHQSSARARGRGRPAKVFVMTDKGRERFNHSYDDLAVAALKYLSELPDDGRSLQGFALARAEELQLKSALDSLPTLQAKISHLSELLSKEGYASSVEDKGNGVEICQHHCPIAHVAAEFPQLCEAETESISRALGTHVQRLATIAHGDGVCTTFVPAVSSVPNSSSRTASSTRKSVKSPIKAGARQ